MALAFVPLDVQVLLLPRVSDVLFASGPVYGLLLAQTLIVLGGLVYYALRRRDTKASTVVVFQLLAQASFAFDIGYYLVVGYHPPFLTSPYITMFLLVHLLYLMGSDLRRSQRAANEKSAALEHLNQGLHEEVDRRNLDLNSFVSIVSHDLKNMLFGLRQMTERLAGQTSPDPAALEQLAASTHRTEDVLASLLRLSSSRLATLKPQRRAVLVAALWSSALQDVSVQLLEGSVTIAHLGDEAATVFTDDTMVTTILRNLLFNAIKASPEGGEVRCETRFENDSTVLSVEDDGPGVPSDRSLHLFSFSERGFGLALSSELADRLGHRLELAPNQNRGAKFRLLLGQSGRAE
ncbi:MAG: HAMP domain-containing sensor histidine kinase [Spirochaetales bacterium]